MNCQLITYNCKKLQIKKIIYLWLIFKVKRKNKEKDKLHSEERYSLSKCRKLYVKDDQSDDIFMRIEDAINEVTTDKIQVLSESEVTAYLYTYLERERQREWNRKKGKK